MQDLVRDSSEFGVPRGRGVARARTPMTVTEARTQYLAIISQPHWCAGVRGRIIPSPSHTDYTAGQCGAVAPSSYASDDMLLCFVPMPDHSFTVDGTYNPVQRASRRLLFCAVVF